MEGEKKGKGAEKMESEETEAWHKMKKGSVFPKRRRLVQRMMYEQMKQVVIDSVKSMTANKASVSPAPVASNSNHE
ncbi:hypothetical protein VNO78_01586 [Psophocarpus tetragonolobus]|uniref:Uncharacterized protein n=1 Tax=Psophocarpus tetragonolobus TaxID=3891 RepID=A0AAN9XUC6_PSOTE